jgi:hypothetical protein
MVDEFSLFHLASDADEIRNLWDDPAHRGRRDRMVALLRDGWRREWYPWASPAAKELS